MTDPFMTKLRVAKQLNFLLVYGEPFQVREMWPGSHSEKPVGSEFQRAGLTPTDRFSHGESGPLVPRPLWDLLFAKTPSPWIAAANVYCISFFFNFYCYSIKVVCLFSPSLHPTPAEPTSLPHLHPPPWFCPCVLYSTSCNPLSSLSPPHSPLTIAQSKVVELVILVLGRFRIDFKKVL